MRLILVLALSIIITGCGDKFSRVDTISGKTMVHLGTVNPAESMNLLDRLEDDFTFSGYLPSVMSVPTSDMIIYARNGMGNFAIRNYLPGNSTSANFAIPNDNYEFYILGYSTANAGGTPLCAIAGPMNLTGSPISLTMTPSTGTCTGAPFNSITPSAVKLCTAATNVAAATIGSDTCTSLGGAIHATVGSIKIEYADDAGSNLKSSCITTTSAVAVSGFPNLPSTNIPVKIGIFAGGSCGSFIANYGFPRGFGNANGSTPFTTIDSTNGADVGSKAKFVSGTTLLISQ